MWIKQIVLAVVGLSCGMGVAGGAFAAIVGIGIIPRFADRTHTAERILWYEDSAALGGIIGNLVSVFNIRLFGGTALAGLYGLFAGMFVGCMAMALAEILNVIPVFTRRIKLKKGLGLVVISMALGKAIGSYIFFFNGW